MKISIKDMQGYPIRAIDGDFGKVEEFYFDDKTWKIRYMVAKTGNWFSGREVLVSTSALVNCDEFSGKFNVVLNCEQVKNSPLVDTDKPVSRQDEMSLHNYYNWPIYWNEEYGSLSDNGPNTILEPQLNTLRKKHENDAGAHLRSTNNIMGYDVMAIDGNVGKVHDFIVDEKKWEIDTIIVDTGTWFSKDKIDISPTWISKINFETNTVYLNHWRKDIKNDLPVHYD